MARLDAVTGTACPGYPASPTGDGHLEIGDEDLLGELDGRGHHRALAVDHERGAVEDELVLAADLIDIDDRASGLGGALRSSTASRSVRRPREYGDALRFRSRRAPAAACSVIGPPAIHMSSQMVTPTGMPATPKRVEGPVPGANQRCSSKTP